MKRPELLIPASSLEVLKTAVVLVQTRCISAEKRLGCGQRPEIFPCRIWRKALHLPMNAA